MPPPYLAKGNYFSCSGRSPFTRLIYPVPVPGGLGTHLTIDLAGQARFGPDVEWIDSLDYAVDPGAGGTASTRRSAATGRRCRMAPAAGLFRHPPEDRPPAAPAQDFVVQGPRDHGVPGLVNLFGIESPGLTASLAIADHVGELADM